MNCTIRLVLAVILIALMVALGFVASQVAFAQGSATPQTRDQVLDRWAGALGGRAALQNARVIHITGKLKTAGMEGTFDRWTTSRGEFRMAVNIPGAFTQTVIFDGQKGWVVDRSGAVQDLSGDILKGVIGGAFEASNSFLLSGGLPGHVEFTGEDASCGAYVLQLVPDGGNTLKVYVDEKTFLPLKQETPSPMGQSTTTFTDWKDFNGVELPGTVTQSIGNPNSDVVLTTEHVEINAPVAAGIFSRPGETPTPVHFNAGEHQAIIPVKIFEQHIYLPAHINGGDTAWFFLDTGAEESFISKVWVQKAGLHISGSLQASGTGAGSATLGVADNIVLNLPGLDISMTKLNVWDYSAYASVVGRQWDGALGYDLISRVVARVDYEHGQLTLFDPATFVPDPRATILPITSFFGNIPVVHAKILLPGREPIEAECLVDSGAGGLHLSTPFVNTNHVQDAVQKTVSSATIGAGGVSKALAGRIAGLQLGPYLLREPVTHFSPDLKEGLLASPAIGALIGGEILERFTVTFDYPHHQILLEPNSQFSETFRTDASGLSVLATGTGFHHFEIDDVAVDSPAKAAGLRKGDVLTSIDGHPAGELDLDKIDHLLEQSGKTIQLTVERNGQTISMRIALKELI